MHDFEKYYVKKCWQVRKRSHITLKLDFFYKLKRHNINVSLTQTHTHLAFITILCKDLTILPKYKKYPKCIIRKLGTSKLPIFITFMTFHVTSMIYKLGTVSHEIGHALGFNHEQSRPDRDEYVTVNFDNIQTSFRNNFDKRTTTDAMTNVPYDYSSAMHYGPYVSGGTSLDFPDSFCFEAHCTTRFIVVIQGHRGGTYQLCRLI